MSDQVYETETRLKSYLDTNQQGRERMCLQILALDKNYSDIHPRHPKGGKDQGRDIEATYKDDVLCFCGVGFVNGACDSKEQKKEINKKFLSDLHNAIEHAKSENLNLKGFVFFTNIDLTNGERNSLVDRAKKVGLIHCEIYHRERMSIALNSPEGFAIRYNFLNIPLTEAEQASFFSKWGDDIQSVISNGFNMQKKAIDRMLFLQESKLPIQYGAFIINLNKKYKAEEIGHMRIICNIIFPDWHPLDKETMLSGFSCLLTDNADRWEGKRNPKPLSGIQHSKAFAKVFNTVADNDEKPIEYIITGKGTGIGYEEIDKFVLEFEDDFFLRYPPVFNIIDFEKSSFVLMISENLKDKIDSVEMFGRGYQLFKLKKDELTYDIPAKEFFDDYPIKFSEEELKLEWVKVTANYGSVYEINFVKKTPKRLVDFE